MGVETGLEQVDFWCRWSVRRNSSFTFDQKPVKPIMKKSLSILILAIASACYSDKITKHFFQNDKEKEMDMPCSMRDSEWHGSAFADIIAAEPYLDLLSHSVPETEPAINSMILGRLSANQFDVDNTAIGYAALMKPYFLPDILHDLNGECSEGPDRHLDVLDTVLLLVGFIKKAANEEAKDPFYKMEYEVKLKDTLRVLNDEPLPEFPPSGAFRILLFFVFAMHNPGSLLLKGSLLPVNDKWISKWRPENNTTGRKISPAHKESKQTIWHLIKSRDPPG
jgi:hypothetical protein